MPNIIIYLDNETYLSFISSSSEKKDEVRKKAVNIIKKNLVVKNVP